MTDAENMEYLFISEMEDRRHMTLMQQARSGYWDEISMTMQDAVTGPDVT